MDSNPQRHCTVPKIFGFRKWFESRYGDLCEAHDGAYERGDCRLCADWTFIKGFVASHRGFKRVPASLAAVLIFAAFQAHSVGKIVLRVKL